MAANLKTKNHAPFGTWPSSIDANHVATGAPRRAESCVHRGYIYWLESVASEKGRMSIMRAQYASNNADHEAYSALEETLSTITPQVENILPQPFNARSSVHEYGGGSFCFDADTLYFVNAADQELYQCATDGSLTPEALTQDTDLRFADIIFDAQRQQIIAVAEQHAESGHDVENFLVSIDLSGKISTLHSGCDFYAYPRLSHNGQHLCWISWQHPNMPWDTTSLNICTLSSGNTLSSLGTLAAQHQQCSLVQPLWADNGDLYFVSDSNNWWNIYRINATQLNPSKQQIADKNNRNELHSEAITNIEGEFATPLWVFRMQNYALANAQTLVATFTQNGRNILCTIDLNSKAIHLHSALYSTVESLHSDGQACSFIASNHDAFPAVFALTSSASATLDAANFLSEQCFTQISAYEPVDSGAISRPEAISFPSSNNQQAYGFYYPPQNSHHHCDGAAPLIVLCHGGPTGQTTEALNFKIQYWTNRGFGVVDVNYRGSTGYGKTYRQQLYKNWGKYDVDDMCAAVDYLVARGDADPEKTIIKGSSAGGYTVLAALTFSQHFRAGVSLYGIGDLELLATDTHKFEAKYLDQLVGPYPEQKALYKARSPINACEQLDCPILFFQGLEDKVVPPNQARTMAAKVKQKGLPVALVEYENEGHGFRVPANIEHMLDAELYFYQCIFKLGTATDKAAPIHIENL